MCLLPLSAALWSSCFLKANQVPYKLSSGTVSMPASGRQLEKAGFVSTGNLFCKKGKSKAQGQLLQSRVLCCTLRYVTFTRTVVIPVPCSRDMNSSSLIHFKTIPVMNPHSPVRLVPVTISILSLTARRRTETQKWLAKNPQKELASGPELTLWSCYT